jgi:3-oxoadipate enol-lactonase
MLRDDQYVFENNAIEHLLKGKSSWRAWAGLFQAIPSVGARVAGLTGVRPIARGPANRYALPKRAEPDGGREIGMNVGGETFNVKVEGPEDAPALMLSNSLGTNLHMWDAHAPEFAHRFRVIRYDSRGHGGSVASRGPYSIERLGRDALAVLDVLGVSKAHWVGLSKGGMVGQWLLANAGERFGRAVLANTAAHYADPSGWNARIAAVRANGMASIVPAVIERWFTPEFQQKEPAAVERIAAMLRATPAEGYAGCCAAIRDMDLREGDRGVKNPVLVIVGGRDPATPPEHGKDIAERIRGAKLVELDAAHLSNIEQPEAFTRAVLAFLEAPEA